MKIIENVLCYSSFILFFLFIGKIGYYESFGNSFDLLKAAGYFISCVFCVIIWNILENRTESKTEEENNGDMAA